MDLISCSSKDVVFRNNEINLAGTIFYPAEQIKKPPAILFVNGWGNERGRSFIYAKSLAKLGFLCFVIDMRGHGNSDGNKDLWTTRDFLTDVVTAYDFLGTLPNVDIENISVDGTSFGGYLVSLLLAFRKVKNLVLRVPADYPDNLLDSSVLASSGKNPDVREWRNSIKTFNDSLVFKAIHNFDGNILLIASELDDQIPLQTIENYKNAVSNKNKLTYVLMKNAPHNSFDEGFLNDVNKIKVEWFRSIL